ncbi:MAG: hypothetical protein ABIX01_18255 [Chitinophagaceae bacterium]
MNRIISHSLVLIAFPLCIMAQPKPADPMVDKKSKTEKKAEKKERVNKLIKQEEEGALVYQKQNVFGFKLATDGWGAFFEKGFMKTVERANLFSLEIGERKSNREQKIPGENTNGGSFGSSYIYGKQNNFYLLKLGVGQSLLLGGKGNKNGVAVSAIYGGGLSLGLLKPYYLKVIDNSTEKQIKYMGDKSRNDTLFLESHAIGSGGIFKGFGELKIKPGIFLKAALRFDYGKYNEMVSAIEAGINAEYYASKIPILVDVKQRRFFLNAFIAIEFGKRR